MTAKSVLKDLYGSKKLGWRVPRMLVIAVVIGVASLMFFENSMIFFPSRFSDADKPYPWRLDNGWSVDVTEVPFTSGDGTQLYGWYYALNAGDAEVQPRHVILYCHGNAGHLANRHQTSATLCSLGVDLFIFDYRGYGKSDGSPDENGVCADGRAAWEVLIERGWRPDQIVIFGKSLGGSVAVDLATKVECAALVTESTFTSIPDMAAEAYPFVPRFLVRTQLNNLAKINLVGCPKLFMHGEKDAMIPAEMARQLHERATAPKTLVTFPQGDHNDIFYQPGYLEAWRSFLAAAIGLKPSEQPSSENTGEIQERP